MPWNTIEPAQGTFSFTELDQELANAAAAGIKLVPIFWYSGWGGSPAAWVTSHEVNSSGAQGTAPAWWDPTAEPAYVTYVTDTVKHIAGEAGYGGSILNYGELDSQLNDGNGNAAGWAPADVTEFHNVYLPDVYSSIGAFNTANGTSYTAFSQVPAAAPGAALAGVYQAFRVWSVQTVYGQLTAQVRAITSGTPLYYYFGGHIGNGVTYANIPDVFFGLARQYTVTVIEDAAQSPGLALLFGSLGRAYGVQVAMEWTAPGDSTQLAAQAVQWIDNYGMALPDGGGEDFFIHDGTQKDVVGFPIYTSWLPDIKDLSGSYPQQPVAVYVDYSQAYGNASGGGLAAPENEVTDLWDGYQAGFAVVTSQEVDNGTVKLSQYKAILPANGVDANLTAYQKAGGTLLTTGSQLSQYAPAYATLASSGVVQIVPVVGLGDQRAADAREHHLGHRLRQLGHLQHGRARPHGRPVPRGERGRHRRPAGGGLRRHLRRGEPPGGLAGGVARRVRRGPVGHGRAVELRRQRAGGLRHADRQPRAHHRAVACLVQRRLHARHAGRREPGAVPERHRALGVEHLGLGRGRGDHAGRREPRALHQRGLAGVGQRHRRQRRGLPGGPERRQRRHLQRVRRRAVGHRHQRQVARGWVPARLAAVGRAGER